jgi:PHD/YefM family antitoxin component YafN of YafNO toxin-antitoxin module
MVRLVTITSYVIVAAAVASAIGFPVLRDSWWIAAGAGAVVGYVLGTFTASLMVVREVESSGRAKVITREGVAVAVLVNVDEYERLAQDASLGRLLREIREAERELDSGDGVPQEVLEQEYATRWGRPIPVSV